MPPAAGVAGLYSLGHGGNESQKTIGLIWTLLVATGMLSATAKSRPGWQIWSCYLPTGLGTLFSGWRIVKTMDQRITKLRPEAGCCVEIGCVIKLFIVAAMGIRASTTHTITGAFVGVSLVRKAARCALAHGRQHRLGLDLHDTDVGLRRRAGPLAQPGAVLGTRAAPAPARR